MQRWIEGFACVWLAGCLFVFLVASWSWPMVGDASLMHYVVFLMHHGMEPYRDIVDMNLPATYMVEGGVMAVLGTGSMGWRLYDFTLMTVSSASLLVILRRQGRLPGILAAALFVLIHGRDGALMAGERDLSATALVLAAVAGVFTLLRHGLKWRFVEAIALLSGLATGTALAIKPSFFPLALGLFCWTLWVRGKRDASFRRPYAYAVCGALIPFVASLGFLVRHHALNAFWLELRGLIPYHASINRWTIGHLISSSFPPLLPLLVLWFAAVYLLRGQAENLERVALIVCALGGLLSYLLQMKAFWYQRYPFLAFLLPLFMIDFASLMRSRTWVRRVGIAGMVTGIVIATTCVIHLRRYDRTEPPRQILRDLSTLGTADELSGQIQCMDAIGGCIDALNQGRIVQSTGFLYDCYMLDGDNAVALDLRRRFWQQIARNPPRAIVITDSNCYAVQHTFDRFGKWPEFRQYLDANFSLERESGPMPPLRYWSHPMEAYQYRIYVRR